MESPSGLRLIPVEVQRGRGCFMRADMFPLGQSQFRVFMAYEHWQIVGRKAQEKDSASE